MGGKEVHGGGGVSAEADESRGMVMSVGCDFLVERKVGGKGMTGKR